MKRIQVEEYYNIKELQNLLNNFEKVYPVVKDNIDNFNIKNNKDKAYLAWIAGINFYKNDIPSFDKIVLEVLFKNMYKILQIEKISDRANLFMFFSLGAVAVINYKNKKNDFYKDYIYIISKGAAIIEQIKFDTYKNGFKYWKLNTISKYFSRTDKRNIKAGNVVTEYNSDNYNRDDFIIN